MLEAAQRLLSPSWARVFCTVLFYRAGKWLLGEQQPTLPQAPGKSFTVMGTMFCHSVLFPMSATKNLHGSAENY